MTTSADTFEQEPGGDTSVIEEMTDEQLRTHLFTLWAAAEPRDRWMSTWIMSGAHWQRVAILKDNLGRQMLFDDWPHERTVILGRPIELDGRAEAISFIRRPA